ncbi:hypothetical protein OF83DRAFT_1176059 [Amylostereum chailletii]|nr:hypothetical protein OF83DRAFT_1176059 [Amylostereum chailletii]
MDVRDRAVAHVRIAQAPSPHLQSRLSSAVNPVGGDGGDDSVSQVALFPPPPNLSSLPEADGTLSSNLLKFWILVSGPHHPQCAYSFDPTSAAPSPLLYATFAPVDTISDVVGFVRNFFTGNIPTSFFATQASAHKCGEKSLVCLALVASFLLLNLAKTWTWSSNKSSTCLKLNTDGKSQVFVRVGRLPAFKGLQRAHTIQRTDATRFEHSVARERTMLKMFERYSSVFRRMDGVLSTPLTAVSTSIIFQAIPSTRHLASSWMTSIYCFKGSDSTGPTWLIYMTVQLVV